MGNKKKKKKKRSSSVWTAKALYDITGQRSSLLPVLILPRFTPCCLFSPSDTFSEPPSVVGICAVSASLSQLLSAARHTDRQTDRAALMPACEHALSAWWSTSGCLLHLVFHYSFILRPEASSEARRAGQRRSRTGPKSRFPHGPSWHRFQAAHISLEYYFSPHTQLEGHPQPS